MLDSTRVSSLVSELSVPLLWADAADFQQRLTSRLAWESLSSSTVESAVREIIAAVRDEGDVALLRYTHQFDRWQVPAAAALQIEPAALHAAKARIDSAQLAALETAAARIRSYHERQLQPSWHYRETDGTMLGQKITPLDSVGIYVPGGKASYPSSVLMNAVPARVAGVEKIVMAVPTPDGLRNDMVLAAAAIAGVDTVLAMGGAQALAAMAYGTQTVPRVDKIVGPGNIYVATAKRQLFGQVGLDMIAGPSEILILCDGGTNPDWIAMDMFSQAEHDEHAQSILVCPDVAYLQQVAQSIERLLPTMKRAAIIRQSLSSRGLFIATSSMDQALAVVNQVAPEHLELSVENPAELLPSIRHAGAIFMGRSTAEALGDYCAGPNHVLPTSGTARFSSPLGVYDFQKRSSLIHCSPGGASELGKVAAQLARGESLEAHARSAEYRIEAAHDDASAKAGSPGKKR
jgi:histidinol dehydrogenase